MPQRACRSCLLKVPADGLLSAALSLQGAGLVLRAELCLPHRRASFCRALAVLLALGLLLHRGDLFFKFLQRHLQVMVRYGNGKVTNGLTF